MGSLALLTAIGIIGGIWLSNNGHEVPPWLSGVITSAGTNLGIIVMAIYNQQSNSVRNGSGAGDAKRQA
jgi:hypothetical protein